MTIYAVKDYQEMSRKAAAIIAAQVIGKPGSVLGLATGSTPEGAYRELIAGYENGDLNFSKVQSVNLDEYQGLSGDHDQSYRYFMNTNLFNHVNIRKECTHVPNGLTEDARQACADYDKLIDELGGVDLQLLGIGGNGHIGFNEPGETFQKGTHLVELTQETREANARFFASIDEVPTHAFTMGVGNIMAAQKVLLMASGKNKANALCDAFFGPIDPKVPASILQLHKNVVVVADEDAMSVIREKGLL